MLTSHISYVITYPLPAAKLTIITSNNGLPTVASCLSQEVLPALLPVLAPRLRPVAEGLLNTEERASLVTATDTMLAYGVRFDQRLCRLPAAAAAAGSTAGAGGRAHVTHVPLNPPVDRMCAFQV